MLPTFVAFLTTPCSGDTAEVGITTNRIDATFVKSGFQQKNPILWGGLKKGVYQQPTTKPIWTCNRRALWPSVREPEGAGGGLGKRALTTPTPSRAIAPALFVRLLHHVRADFVLLSCPSTAKSVSNVHQ